MHPILNNNNNNETLVLNSTNTENDSINVTSYIDTPGVEVVQESFATIAARCTGSLSTISSLLIIYMIFKSKSKLSTIYHRIMFGMSIADILGSIAMALTTLPMPRDGVPDFGWVGTRIGNRDTCTIQGFFFLTGFVCMFGYNMTLCLYNTLAIVYRMREHNIVKYAEPFFHIVPVGMALGMAIPLLITDLVGDKGDFNGYIPSGWDVWCTPISRPLLEQTIIGIILMVTLGCFICMIYRVYQVEKELRGPRGIVRRSPRVQRAEKYFQNTKVIIKQCFIYFVSYLITLSFPLGRSLTESEPLWFSNLAFLMMPLQGFYNFLIFLSHKVYNYKIAHQSNEEHTKTLFQIIHLLFVGEPEEIILFSRISIIRYDKGNRVLMDLELADEMDYEVVVHDGVSVEEERSSVNVISAINHDKSRGSRDNSHYDPNIHNSSDKDNNWDDNMLNGLSVQDLSGFSNQSLSSAIQSQKHQYEDNSILHSVKQEQVPPTSRRSNSSTSKSPVVDDIIEGDLSMSVTLSRVGAENDDGHIDNIDSGSSLSRWWRN